MLSTRKDHSEAASTRLIRRPEVEAKTGLGRSHIYAEMKEGRFPKSVPLSGKARAWVEGEVDAWIAARIAQRDGKVA